MQIHLFSCIFHVNSSNIPQLIPRWKGTNLKRLMLLSTLLPHKSDHDTTHLTLDSEENLLVAMRRSGESERSRFTWTRTRTQTHTSFGAAHNRVGVQCLSPLPVIMYVDAFTCRSGGTGRVRLPRVWAPQWAITHHLPTMCRITYISRLSLSRYARTFAWVCVSVWVCECSLVLPLTLDTVRPLQLVRFVVPHCRRRSLFLRDPPRGNTL